MGSSWFELIAGTWTGRGTGHYPTIESFEYTEELVIAPIPGKPVATWQSRTRDAATSEPKHGEFGVVRVGDTGVELVLAHSFGVTEISTGEPDDTNHMEFTSVSVVSSPTAKRIDSVVRHYRFDGDVLAYDISMAAVGVELTHHLSAEVRRA